MLLSYYVIMGEVKGDYNMQADIWRRRGGIELSPNQSILGNRLAFLCFYIFLIFFSHSLFVFTYELLLIFVVHFLKYAMYWHPEHAKWMHF